MVKIFRMSYQILRASILTWLIVIHVEIGGGGASMDREARQEKNKTKCLIYRSPLREINPLLDPELNYMYS